MKRFLVLAAAAAVVAGFAVSSTNAAVTVTESPERGYVTISASANKELTPDLAEISISVVTSDNKSMQNATLENKEISGKVYTALKEMINTENGDYVKTSNFRANPIYTYSSNGKKNLSKYEVSNTVTVHTKSIDKVGDMIDKAISLGATDVSNLSFTLSKYEQECDALLATATQRARTQADSMVKAAGSSITGIKTINGSCSPNTPSRVTYRNMMLNAKAADAVAAEGSSYGESIPVQAGAVKIYANVNASFFVK